MPVSIIRPWNSTPAGASFRACGAVFTRYCRRDAFAHQPGKTTSRRGVRRAACCAGMKTENCNPRLFVGQFDGTAEQAQSPVETVYAESARTKAKRQKGFCREARLSRASAPGVAQWSSRYGQYPKAQAAQPD
ncbi:DUF2138 family protein [Shigella flexneri]